jgi:hypothetical protein
MTAAKESFARLTYRSINRETTGKYKGKFVKVRVKL